MIAALIVGRSLKCPHCGALDSFAWNQDIIEQRGADLAFQGKTPVLAVTYRGPDTGGDDGINERLFCSGCLHDVAIPADLEVIYDPMDGEVDAA